MKPHSLSQVAAIVTGAAAAASAPAGWPGLGQQAVWPGQHTGE